MSYEGGPGGPTGPTGPTGANGVGTQGPTGETGPTGANGTEYIPRGVYTYSTSAPPSYIANDLVLNTVQVTDNLSTPLNTPDNNTYVCIQSLANPYGAPGPLDPNDGTWVNYWQVFVSGGPTGPAGPTGPSAIASGFYGGNPVATLTNNGPAGTLIGSAGIVTTESGFLMAFVTATFRDASNDEEIIDMYVNIDGTVSATTSQTIIKDQGGFNGYVPITIFQRTSSSVSAGNHTCEVYAYTQTAATLVTCDHLDIAILGNLANY